MIESISHITFVVKDLAKTAHLWQELFQAQEVYNSGNETHSLFKERFFIVGQQWIAVMEDTNIVNRTYHHVAFKIAEDDVDFYLAKIKALQLELKPARPRIAGEDHSLYFYDYDNNLFELHTGTLEERLAAYNR